jgi:Tol biopolymer transport system component
MPDGRIVFSSNRGGQNNLWLQAADGVAEQLTTGGNPQFPTGITPDGTAVIFYELTPTMARDLMQVALDGTHRVTAVLQTKFDERNGSVSPDGRWLVTGGGGASLGEGKYTKGTDHAVRLWAMPTPATMTEFGPGN